MAGRHRTGEDPARLSAGTGRLSEAGGGFGPGRDRAAGLLMAAVGAGAIVAGAGYGVGTLGDMGSGFFPVALGAGLVLTGALMAVGRPGPEAAGHGPAVRAPNWRGAAAIAAAVALFILLAGRAGLAPATFACVFAGALGTVSTRWWEAALLAAGVTVFGVALFRFGLQLPFPILRGVLP